MKERDFEKYTIKEMPEDERPQEKLIKFGPDYLSNAELLALIIRTGSRKGDSAIDTATKVLRSLRSANDSNGLNSLKNASLSNLMEVDGIGEAKAAMSVLEQEHFRIMTLNTKKEINFIREISKGTINMTIVHSREVFRAAISDNAHSIILLHNHPTGDPSPSKEDIKLTKNLLEASKIIGIDILDHIIIGDNKYFSFLEEGLL